MSKEKYIESLDKARDLGLAITDSKEYSNLKEAEKNFLNNQEASNLINLIEKKKEEFNLITRKKEYDSSYAKEVLNDIKKIQKDIDSNPIISHLYHCQKEYDKLIKNINDIIDYMTGNNRKKNGCSNCSGCSKNG